MGEEFLAVMPPSSSESSCNTIHVASLWQKPVYIYTA